MKKHYLGYAGQSAEGIPILEGIPIVQQELQPLTCPLLLIGLADVEGHGPFGGQGVVGCRLAALQS